MNNLNSVGHAIWTLRRAQILSAGKATPKSIVCPVASATLSAYTNSIYMDHDRLPTMQPFVFTTPYGTETVNGHDLDSEFVYICANQWSSGSFHLMGESGIFTLGFASLAVSPDSPTFTVAVTKSDFGSGGTVELNGCEQKTVFLAKGDWFNVFCTLPNDLAEADNKTLDGLRTNFAITRMSRNVGYVHPASP